MGCRVFFGVVFPIDGFVVQEGFDFFALLDGDYSREPYIFVEHDDAGAGAEGDGLRVFEPGDLLAFAVNIGRVVDHMDRSDDSTDVERGRTCADVGDVQGVRRGFFDGRNRTLRAFRIR